MDVSYCALTVLLLLGVIGGIPAAYALSCWPPMRKACKYLFTDHPMTLGILFSVALLAVVRLVSCEGGTVAKTQKATQVASVCTCGCGRHK